MRILIIHASNLPVKFLNAGSEPELEFLSFPISQASISQESYDSFLLRSVRDIISPEDPAEQPFHPDLIILPYSLSSVNPAELTGVRLAAHIRLEEKDNALKKAPILFLGPVTLEEAIRIAPESSILLTPKVFMSNLSDLEELKKWIETNRQQLSPLSDAEYIQFVERIEVDAPSNFNDSSHSVTNRWNILRWEEMFDWKEASPQLHPSVNDFAKSLYFRWLQVSLGSRTRFRKKDKTVACIPNIKDKTIVYIDDEYFLGWGEIMSRIFANSNSSFVPFEDFNSSYSRDELVERIKAFIDENPNGDCYILDLRLHEEDHVNPDHTLFSGHKIAQYIYEKNHGSQIVFFTASEKTMNYVYSEKYFSGYVIKENPEHLFNRKESYQVFVDFSHAIQRACNNSYLKDYFKLCKDIPYLEDFFEILRLDDSDTKVRDINLRSAALNLIVFIESSIKERYRMDGLKVVTLPDSTKLGDASNLYIRSEQIPGSTKAIPREMCISDFAPLPQNDWKQVTSSDIFLICATLSKVYGIITDDINKVIELKNIRNQSIAHGHGPQVIDIQLLTTIFNKVVRVMLNNLPK